MKFSEKVEQCGVHGDVVLDSGERYERPTALLSALIRRWESLRALEVSQWQGKDIVLCGMPLMGAMEGQSVPSGNAVLDGRI